MKDLIAIIRLEKNTLIRGFKITFTIVFLLTFFPPILKNGFSFDVISNRVLESLMYSTGFSIFLNVFVVLINYNNLLDRKKLFKKSAFKHLQFQIELIGVGSIINELETILVCEVESYFYKIRLVQTENEYKIIEIIPVIYVKNTPIIEAELINRLGFNTSIYLNKELPFSKYDLDKPAFILRKLQQMSADFKRLDISPMTPNN